MTPPPACAKPKRLRFGEGRSASRTPPQLRWGGRVLMQPITRSGVWMLIPAGAMPSNSLPFFRGWSRDPVAVGLPFPSSPWTARRLAQATLDAAIDGGGPVLELGAGAGAVTQALIEGGCSIDQLVVIERDAELCRTLERRFQGLCVL